LAGENFWSHDVRPLVKKIGPKLDRLRAGEIGSLSRTLARLVLHKVGERATGLVLVAKPADVRDVQPVRGPAETIAFHDDHPYDLLKWHGNHRETAWQIAAKARFLAEAQHTGRTFHSVLVNDRLAGWGFSYWPSEPAHLTETGGTLLDFPARSVAMYDFYTLPEFRGRKIYQALLCYILRKRFAEGAEQAYISVLERNTRSLRAIQRAGFQVVMRNRYVRFLRWKRTQSSASAPPAAAGEGISSDT